MSEPNDSLGQEGSSDAVDRPTTAILTIFGGITSAFVLWLIGVLSEWKDRNASISISMAGQLTFALLGLLFGLIASSLVWLLIKNSSLGRMSGGLRYLIAFAVGGTAALVGYTVLSFLFFTLPSPVFEFLTN